MMTREQHNEPEKTLTQSDMLNLICEYHEWSKVKAINKAIDLGLKELMLWTCECIEKDLQECK